MVPSAAGTVLGLTLSKSPVESSRSASSSMDLTETGTPGWLASLAARAARVGAPSTLAPPGGDKSPPGQSMVTESEK